MPRALVLLNVESGREDEVLGELRKVDGVQEAFVSYGEYDLVATVKADTMDALKDVITFRVRRIERVKSTLTLILIEE